MTGTGPAGVPPGFMSALVTEHSVLQGASSSTVSESGNRVSIYLSALSSGLVAIGFTRRFRRALESLALTVLRLSLLNEHRRLTPAVLSGPAPAADR